MYIYDSDNGVVDVESSDLLCRVGDGPNVTVEADPSITTTSSLYNEEGDGWWDVAVPGETLTLEGVKAVLAKINDCSPEEISIEIPDWAKKA